MLTSWDPKRYTYTSLRHHLVLKILPTDQLYPRATIGMEESFLSQIEDYALKSWQPSTCSLPNTLICYEPRNCLDPIYLGSQFTITQSLVMIEANNFMKTAVLLRPTGLVQNITESIYLLFLYRRKRNYIFIPDQHSKLNWSYQVADMRQTSER